MYVLTSSYHRNHRLIIFAVSQIGLVLGPLIGGALSTYTTWRWCFYINLPIGALVAALLVFTRVPEQREKGRAVEVLPTFFKTFDILGFVLFAPAAIQLLLALQYGGNQYAWDSATVIGLFCGAGAMFLVFLGWEYRMGKDAMIPFHVVRNRIVSCSCVVIMTLFGMTITASYYLPIYFQAVRDKTPLVSGVDLLPGVLCQIFMALVTGALTGRIGYYLPFAVLGGILNAVGCGLLSTLSPTTPTREWAGYQALIGFGRGAGLQTVSPIIRFITLSDVSDGEIAHDSRSKRRPARRDVNSHGHPDL
jgi:Na+/melibiose symporter-like transporter